MHYVVFDIETIGGFRGSFDPNDIELTICCTYDSATDSYDSFLKEDLPRLWKLFEGIDALVGYNSDHFDIPILNKYYPGDLSRIRSIDLLKEVQVVIDRRIKLDMLAEGTLNARKSGSGNMAPQWWREGNIKKLREYCLKDVELTKRIFDYAREHNSLKYKELGKTHEIKLDASGWLAADAPKAAITHTLGY